MEDQDLELDDVEAVSVEAEDSKTAAEPAEDVAEDEQGDEDTESTPEVEMPRFWKESEQELFKSLNPEAQSVIVQKERERNADHRRLQEEIAADKKEVAERSQQVQQQLSRLAEQAKFFDTALTPPDEDLDDPESDKYDPDEFKRQMKAYKGRKAEVEKLKGEYEEAQKEANEKAAAESMEIYRKEFPEFLDKQKSPQIHKELIEEAMFRLGLDERSAVEALKATPAQQMMVLRDAMKYRKAQGVRKKAAKTPPKTQKPGGTNQTSKPRDAATILYG